MITRWHRSERDRQIIQKKDEADFQQRFRNLGFGVQKLDESTTEKSPDYELNRNGNKIIAELKSRFPDEEYGRVTTELTKRLSSILFGFNYRLTHFYEQMPDNRDIEKKIALIEKELAALSPSLKLPYALRMGTYGTDNVYQKLMDINPAEREIYEEQVHEYYASRGDGTIAVELIERNQLGFLKCVWVMDNSTDNLLVTEKCYFDRTLKDAKKQLNQYIGRFPVGVIYMNHSPYSWDKYNVISLYGDLKVAFSRAPGISEARLFLGENKVIREDRKQWLSFIGLMNCEIESNICIYCNGFASIPLDRVFFDSPDIEVHLIALSQDGASIIIE